MISNIIILILILGVFYITVCNFDTIEKYTEEEPFLKFVYEVIKIALAILLILYCMLRLL